tara:strand:+ start:244 stop:564 length:321 start_codon:yes stop_codon:yes gene_type:complete
MDKAQLTFTLHSDSGHGWLGVPIVFLKKINMTAANFTGFSYLDDEKIYLEEDCDCYIFQKAIGQEAWNNIVFIDDYVEGEHPIRRLDFNHLSKTNIAECFRLADTA